MHMLLIAQCTQMGSLKSILLICLAIMYIGTYVRQIQRPNFKGLKKFQETWGQFLRWALSLGIFYM
jgi:hypothetical protein